jgi:hypothetical protein
MLSHSGVTMFECARCGLFPIETAAASCIAATQVASVDNSLFVANASAMPHHPVTAVTHPCEHG